MLSPELDVLRNKELSIWCLLQFKEKELHDRLWLVFLYKYVREWSSSSEWYDGYKLQKWDLCCSNMRQWQFKFFTLNSRENMYWKPDEEWERICDKYVDKYFEVLWKPLTRWRLYHLCHWRKPAYLEMGEPEYEHAEYNKFYLCFENINDIFYDIGFDKTELERMQHDKWNELYPLLVEFSSYFSK